MPMRLTGMATGLDTDTLIKDLMTGHRIKVDKVKKNQTLVEWKKQAWNDMNKLLYGFYKGPLAKFKSQSTFFQNAASISDSNTASVTAQSGAMRGTHSLEVIELAKNAVTTGSVIADTSNFTSDETLTLDYGTKSAVINIANGDSISTVISKINAETTNTGITAYYDSVNKRISMTASAGDGATDGHTILIGGTATAKLGLDSVVSTAGKYGEIMLNGVTYGQLETNEITVNGINIKAKAKTTAPVSITVSQDTDAIYNSVKNFVNEYNKLLTAVNEKLNAVSAKGYSPLTDEQKASMSAEDINKWETKIQDSLLRKDPALSGIANSMREVITTFKKAGIPGFETLADFGIVTGNYTEKGILHIKGDPEDSVYSGYPDKLRAAIEQDPQKVAELFTAVGQAVHDDLFERMKSTSLRSALTFFNDKQMDNEISSYKTKLYQMERKLGDLENGYYKKFAALEKMMNQMNSQSNWLSQQLSNY